MTQEQEVIDAMSKCAGGFERSAKGNLWRKVGLITVSVFPRPYHGTYGWCVADGSEKRWSKLEYDTEADALDALLVELANEGII